MKNNVSIASCNGMSNFGLICRAIASDLSESEEKISSICITSTAAGDGNLEIIKKYPIIALNGCSNDCVNKILKNKGIDVVETFDIGKYAHKNKLKPDEVARLNDNGEKIVKKLKNLILKELNKK